MSIVENRRRTDHDYHAVDDPKTWPKLEIFEIVMTLLKDAPGLTIPTTLILDFHDSYTRNLLSLFSELDLGPLSVEGYDPISWNTENWSERVVVINVDTLTWEELTDNVLPYFSCVILGPGPGTPHKKSDFSWPTRLIEEYGSDLPIFGWCLGHQGLATTFGGQVVRASSPRHGQTSRIHHDDDPLFKGCPPTFEAVQYNSLVVSREQLPKELQVIAWTESGPKSEIMALRHKTKPLWGIQFHPEVSENDQECSAQAMLTAAS